MNHYPFDTCFCSGFWGWVLENTRMYFLHCPWRSCPTWASWLQNLTRTGWTCRVHACSACKQRLDGCLTGLLRWGWWFFLRHTRVHSSLTRGGGCQCDPQEGWTVTDINRAVPGRNPKAPTHPIHPDHICLPAQSCAPSPPPAAAAVPMPLWGWYSE